MSTPKPDLVSGVLKARRLGWVNIETGLWFCADAFADLYEIDAKKKYEIEVYKKNPGVAGIYEAVFAHEMYVDVLGLYRWYLDDTVSNWLSTTIKTGSTFWFRLMELPTGIWQLSRPAGTR